MAICATCQTDNPEAARFCIACGSSLSAACTSCGTALPPGARFCPTCGAPVAVASGPRGEERKLVTILFCDLVGFTAQAEQLDPEDVRALQRPYFERVRTEIERFGGTVEKFIGDAVMAAFGAPVAHEDDAERAVRAALAIRDGAREPRDRVTSGSRSTAARRSSRSTPSRARARASSPATSSTRPRASRRSRPRTGSSSASRRTA